MKTIIVACVVLMLVVLAMGQEGCDPACREEHCCMSILGGPKRCRRPGWWLSRCDAEAKCSCRRGLECRKFWRGSVWGPRCLSIRNATTTTAPTTTTKRVENTTAVSG